MSIDRKRVSEAVESRGLGNIPTGEKLVLNSVQFCAVLKVTDRLPRRERPAFMSALAARLRNKPPSSDAIRQLHGRP